MKMFLIQITNLWNALPISIRLDVELVPFLQISLSEVPPCQYCYTVFLLTFFLFPKTSFFWFSFITGVAGNGYQFFLRAWLGVGFT